MIKGHLFSLHFLFLKDEYSLGQLQCCMLCSNHPPTTVWNFHFKMWFATPKCSQLHYHFCSIGGKSEEPKSIYYKRQSFLFMHYLLNFDPMHTNILDEYKYSRWMSGNLMVSEFRSKKVNQISIPPFPVLQEIS